MLSEVPLPSHGFSGWKSWTCVVVTQDTLRRGRHLAGPVQGFGLLSLPGRSEGAGMCKVPRAIDYGNLEGMDDLQVERLARQTTGVVGIGKPNFCVQSSRNGGVVGCSACRAPSVDRFRGSP